MGVCDVPIISNVCDIAGEAAATLVSAPFEWAAQAMGAAAGYLFEAVWKAFDTTTLVDVQSRGYIAVYNLIFGIGVSLMLLFFCLQLITGLIKRDPGAFTRALFGLARSVLGSFIVIALVALGLEIVDQLCVGIIQAAGETTESLGGKIAVLVAGLTAITAAAPGVGVILIIFLAGLAIAAATIVWLSLLIRKALLLVTVALAPLAFSGSAWDVAKGWIGKWAMFVIALIVSKLVLVVIFLVAVTQVSAPISTDLSSLSDPLAGIVLMAMAGFAPYMVYRFLSFIGVDLYAQMGAEQDTKNALNRPVPTPTPGSGEGPKKILDSDSGGASGAGSSAGTGGGASANTPASVPGTFTAGGASGGSGASMSGTAAGAAGGAMGVGVAGVAGGVQAAQAGAEAGQALASQVEQTADAANNTSGVSGQSPDDTMPASTGGTASSTLTGGGSSPASSGSSVPSLLARNLVESSGQSGSSDAQASESLGSQTWESSGSQALVAASSPEGAMPAIPAGQHLAPETGVAVPSLVGDSAPVGSSGGAGAAGASRHDASSVLDGSGSDGVRSSDPGSWASQGPFTPNPLFTSTNGSAFALPEPQAPSQPAGGLNHPAQAPAQSGQDASPGVVSASLPVPQVPTLNEESRHGHE